MITLSLNDIVIETIRISREDYGQACVYLEACLVKIQSQPLLLNKLGLGFRYRVEFDFACRCFSFLLRHYPKHQYAHNNLGLMYNRLGKSDKAVEHYRCAIDIQKDFHPARSNLAYALNYFGSTGRSQIKQAHQDIANAVFNKTQSYIDQNRLSNKTRLNLGYVSSDLRDHAVGRFMVGILESHNRTDFNIHIFDNRANNNDATAQHLKSLDLTWHKISGVSTHASCALIAKQKIDVLIDLSGHTKGGRPDIFSNRVAPVQITYLGYPNTSGLPNMDFRIGDVFADPNCNDQQNTETLLKLTTPMWNYTPWSDMPDRSPPPFQKNGYITFGSANNHAKLQAPWLAVWAKVLAALPETRLIVKSRALRSPAITVEFLDFFAQRGISRERIEIINYSPATVDHWSVLQKFDIGLDSFPYNGTTTTCDLLWLGIPSVTRQGNSHVSRTTASLLSGLGMQSWVADTDDEFVQLCEEKSQAHSELTNYRNTLRTHIQNSSLGDSQKFISAYEQLLKEAWRLNRDQRN